MASESNPDSSRSPTITNPPPDKTQPKKRKNSLWLFTFLLSFLAPVVVAALFLYQLDSFDPAHLPTHEFTHQQKLTVPRRNGRMTLGSELIGFGVLLAPEDVLYDPESRLIYTGCADGWVKRVTVNESVDDSVVENWVNTGGRPLGLALGLDDNEVFIADAYKGLLRATGEGVVELLTDKAEGVRFKLTDGVDVADDGTIYFTDASYKYALKDFIWDFLEGRPHGRLMSYDPSTKQTIVLAKHLYFPNGLAISPDQDFVVFCETALRKCKKLYIQGERKGSIETFIDNLPGMPDNIRYDGDGHYWIALATGATVFWDLAQRYPIIRKGLAIMERYGLRPNMEKNSGVLVVDTEGKPSEHYYDPRLALISSGIKIGNHLYCGSVAYPYILRLDLTQYPATAGI